MRFTDLRPLAELFVDPSVEVILHGAENDVLLLQREFEAFVRRVEADQDTALDPYGAHSEEEFFAVASESFFVNPLLMKQEHPDLYGVLGLFYRQDPAAERPPSPRA